MYMYILGIMFKLSVLHIACWLHVHVYVPGTHTLYHGTSARRIVHVHTMYYIHINMYTCTCTCCRYNNVHVLVQYTWIKYTHAQLMSLVQCTLAAILTSALRCICTHHILCKYDNAAQEGTQYALA